MIATCRNASGRRTPNGAIAYGAQSEAFGFSYGLTSGAAAERRALANCVKHGNDCRIVASFSNSCAAVAAGTNTRFATAQASTRKQAEAGALAGCSRGGGDDCEIKAWTCALP